MSRFDWYSASYQGDPHKLLRGLRKGLEGFRAQEVRPHLGYAFAQRVEASRGFLATVQWGGQHKDGIHAFGSGSGSPRFADLVRDIQPEHKVTRADVCEDFVEAGGYDRLKAMCRSVADQHRVRVRNIDDDGRGEEGRTFYCGAPTSAVRTRLYEKGRQIMETGGMFIPPEGLDASDLSAWVRLEAQVRPDGQARWDMATAKPEEFWGAAAWTLDLVKAVLDMNVRRVVVGSVWRAEDDERAYRHMVTQYGAMLGRLARDLGSWECVGLTIGHDVKEAASRKLNRRGKP